MSFAFIFTCGIRIFRVGTHTFDLWIGRIVAVDCSRAAEDQFFHARPRRFFQNNCCTPGIDLGAFVRLLYGFLHARHGREMKNKVHAFHGFPHEIAIEN